MITLLQRIKNRITRRVNNSVFLRSDFEDLGGYDQVGRALRLLTKEGKLIKAGYGVYIKARRNRINNQLMLDIKGGADAALLETLKRLKVDYELDGLTKAYVDGGTNQIPARIQIKLKTRFNRKLTIGNHKLNVA